MANKDLKYFLRKYEEKVVSVPAPKSFVDENGKQLHIEIRTLPASKTQEILDAYKRRTVATDKKGRPYNSANNEVLWKVENDGTRAFNRLIAEALVYPDLRDQKAMEFYECYDIDDMAMNVFASSEEYEHVSKAVAEVLGLNRQVDDEESLVKEVKN